MKHFRMFRSIGALSLAFMLCVATPAAFAKSPRKHASGLVFKELKVGNFSELESASVNVAVTVGSVTGTARLEAPENLIDKVEISSKKGTLKAYFKNKADDVLKKASKKAVTLYVTVPSLTGIQASVGADIRFSGAMTCDKMEVEASTGASVRMPSLTVNDECELEASTGAAIEISSLYSDRLDAVSSTGADIVVKGGTVRKADFEASTGASINCQDLDVKSGAVNASTGGSVAAGIRTLTGKHVSLGGYFRNSK